jgi:hypothetical protein
MIETLNSRNADVPSSDEALAWFYCNRNDSIRRDTNSILRSLVRQLSYRKGKGVQPYIVDVFEDKDEGFDMIELTNEDCTEILLNYANIYPQTTLVLDALDECEPKTRGMLLKSFDKLVERSSKPVKIFISSRRDRDISDRFCGGPNVEISARDNQDDIATFVRTRIEEDDRWASRMSSDLRRDIAKTLLRKSKGMLVNITLPI